MWRALLPMSGGLPGLAGLGEVTAAVEM